MNKLSGFLIAVVLLVSTVTASRIAARSGDPHDFSGRCESCHLTSPREGQKNIFTMDIDALCVECHELAVKNSHPTRMVPSMKVPDYYFLDWQGRLNCATCHNPHAESAMMLRSQARGRGFCETCHQGGVLSGGHVAASSVAHTKNWTPPSNASFGQILDRVSLECMVCHEGSVGPAANVRIGSSQSLSYVGPGFSHPIGIDYGLAAANDRQLRPLDDLSKLISLYEGKVGCASCHNQFSHEGDMLVFSNRGSALCLECHIK